MANLSNVIKRDKNGRFANNVESLFKGGKTHADVGQEYITFL